jgi:hypothetical protein
MVPWESLSYSHPVFRPYTAALGQIALAWNGLHTEMAMLFCPIMGGGYANQFLAVWHALKNDRSQRAILEAAAKEARNVREYETEIGKKLLEEIHWINSQANIIEDERDDALHSPLWGSGKQVLPLSGLGHTRAKKLMEAGVQRGLLTEFRWCRDATLVLTDYVKDISSYLSGQKSWPERPSLPYRGQSKKNVVPPPKTASKTSSRPSSN